MMEYYFFAVLRIILYLWVGVEFLSLNRLYSYGYEKYKKTPIIRSLKNTFLFSGIDFLYVSILPIVNQENQSAFKVMVAGVVPILILLIIALRNFRHYSITRTTLKLPKDKKDK